MHWYTLLKHVHMTSAAVSIAGFVLRGLWMLGESPMLGRRWVRVLPHVVDTVLLGSAIALAFLLRAAPGYDGWLTAKVLGLLAYIALGTVALKRGRTKGQRTAAWVAAIAVFGYIVSVAFTKDPRGFLAAWF